MNNRIAVIIPCYNHARYIGEALESVLSQTRPPDRIIVIDDGSKDDSMKVMEPFVTRGVELRGRENRGAHETINELIREAATDCGWVSILNSDDRYLPRRMQQCMAVAEANPGKSVISTRLEVIDADGQRMKEDEPRARWFYGVQSIGEGLTPAEWLGRGNFIATTSNVFARAEYLLANPFRPYRFNHDYFFLAGAAWRDEIALNDEVLMQYRVHGSNTITTRPEPLIREMLRMHLDLFHDYAEPLATDAGMRRRFFDYMRALWDNMSSFHAGMFYVMVAQLVKKIPESELAALADTLTGPEFETSPNRSLAGAYDGREPLSIGTVSRKLDTLREDKIRWQKERECLLELSRLRGEMARSRWVSLGSAMGLGKTLHKNEGKGSVEKLERLREACLKSMWLRIGSIFGSRTSKALRCFR
jgi:glycosyltransferase involved in cell wall biosynthesis